MDVTKKEISSLFYPLILFTQHFSHKILSKVIYVCRLFSSKPRKRKVMLGIKIKLFSTKTRDDNMSAIHLKLRKWRLIWQLWNTKIMLFAYSNLSVWDCCLKFCWLHNFSPSLITPNIILINVMKELFSPLLQSYKLRTINYIVLLTMSDGNLMGKNSWVAKLITKTVTVRQVLYNSYGKGIKVSIIFIFLSKFRINF